MSQVLVLIKNIKVYRELSITLQLTLRNIVSKQERWHIKKFIKNLILWIYRSWKKGLMIAQIIVKNRILNCTVQISVTLYGIDFCWVCEALQLSAGECIVL